jgi:hypothetical protein
MWLWITFDSELGSHVWVRNQTNSDMDVIFSSEPATKYADPQVLPGLARPAKFTIQFNIAGSFKLDSIQMIIYQIVLSILGPKLARKIFI